MSSTEPPSRIPPRQQTGDTKAAREELSSKGKVEKIREVDPDEETRKKKFMQYYKGVDDEGVQEERPSPFDLYSKTPPQTGTEERPLSSRPPSLEDVEDTVIPGPSYTPPPDVRGLPVDEEETAEDDNVTEGALPQSDDFWEEYDLHDQSPAPSNFQETPGLAKQPPTQGSTLPEHRKRTGEIQKKEKMARHIEVKADEKRETHEKIEKKKEPSPFGPPGKPQTKETKKEPLAAPFREERKEKPSKETEKKKLPSPFEEPPVAARPRQTFERTAAVKGKERGREREEEGTQAPQEIMGAPVRTETGGEGEREGGREDKILEIEAPSLPSLPTNIVPMATAATTQVAPYLTPSTVSLFYQMVGTMYVMAGPQGVSRTEVLLNNPAFANSKFFGATITIEKYATAPDSFNIRLTGSHEAVASFKDNVPSLLAAFENGNFNFRVGRLDVEYTLERPVFRRKEKGEERGEAGGGDLGERRNK